MPTNAWKNGVTVTLRDGVAVTVREMDWNSALDFLSLLSKHASEFLGPIVAGRGNTETAQFQVILDKLVKDGPALVLKVRELGDYLLTYSVEFPPDYTPAVADALNVLKVAIGMNLSTEVLEAAKALGETVAAVLIPTVTPTPRPQP